MPSRLCTQYISKCGRSSSGHRTGNGQSSFHFPRRVVLKKVLTIGQLHSSLMLLRSCLKSCLLGFITVQTKNFQMSKLGLEKEEEPEIKLPTFTGSYRKREFQKNIYLCFIEYPKAFVWIITNCEKLLKKWEY